MNEIYARIFERMEFTVHRLARSVPAPQLVQVRGRKVYRYEEKSPAQAIVQKLARLVSTLRATLLLLDHGFTQEVGMLKRVVDETQQDVFFLVLGLQDLTPRHEAFLDDFYEEEFDADSAFASTQKRGMIPRRKIRATIARFVSDVPGTSFNPSQTAEACRTLDKAYSGYVHGASPHIMELYGGNPSRFHMDGMQGTPLARSQGEDFRNYVYRSICACATVARAFGDEASYAEMRECSNWFARFLRGRRGASSKRLCRQ